MSTITRLIPGAIGSSISHGRYAAAGLLILVAACNETTPPRSVPVEPVRSAASVVIDPETNDWDAFDADVNISFYGQSAGVSSLPDPSRAVGYHVHRWQDGSGAWRSDFTHGNYRPEVVGGAPGDMDPPRIARAYGGGGSITPSFYDVNGNYMALEHPLGEQPSGNGAYVPGAGAPGPQPPPPPSGPYLKAEGASASGVQSTASMQLANGTPSPAVRMPNVHSRAWVNRYIVTPKAKERIRQQLTDAAGPGRSREPGATLFAMTRGNKSVEFDLDDARGVVREMRVSVDGTVQAITRREYEEQNGLQILRRERITRNLPHGRTMQMEVEYSNLKLYKKEK